MTVFLSFLLSFIFSYATSWLAKRIHWTKFWHIGRHHIHHTITGLLIMCVGLLFPTQKAVLFAIGFGFYVAHGFEELWIYGVPFPKAFFVFVTED